MHSDNEDVMDRLGNNKQGDQRLLRIQAVTYGTVVFATARRYNA